MIDIWLKTLPFLYAALWGGENLVDPSISTIGPTDSAIYAGLGPFRGGGPATRYGVEGAFNYVYGWSFLNLRPQATVFADQRGDFLAGVGVNDEYVFKNVNLAADGSMPVFLSWSAGPSYYAPGPRPQGFAGAAFQFHLVNEIGFYLNRSVRVSIAFDHYSSGGLTQPNPNSDAITLNIGMRF